MRGVHADRFRPVADAAAQIRCSRLVTPTDPDAARVLHSQLFRQSVPDRTVASDERDGHAEEVEIVDYH